MAVWVIDNEDGSFKQKISEGVLHYWDPENYCRVESLTEAQRIQFHVYPFVYTTPPTVIRWQTYVETTPTRNDEEDQWYQTWSIVDTYTDFDMQKSQTNELLLLRRINATDLALQPMTELDKQLFWMINPEWIAYRTSGAIGPILTAMMAGANVTIEEALEGFTYLWPNLNTRLQFILTKHLQCLRALNAATTAEELLAIPVDDEWGVMNVTDENPTGAVTDTGTETTAS